MARSIGLNHISPAHSCVETTDDIKVTRSDYPQSQVKVKYPIRPQRKRRSGIILPESRSSGTVGVEASIVIAYL